LVQKHKYRQSKAESFGKGVAHALDALILAVEKLHELEQGWKLAFQPIKKPPRFRGAGFLT
jgi:hypothetical protein